MNSPTRRSFLRGFACVAAVAPTLAIVPAQPAVPAPEETELEEAERMVAQIKGELRDLDTYSGVMLSAPGCLQGCPSCFRKCAVTRIQLNWWTNELTRLKSGGLTA